MVEWLLDRAKIPGWTRASTLNIDANSRSHMKRIASSIEESGADLLHITNQLDAGMVPTKGIALPLISRGGTGWILTAFCLGLVIAIERGRNRAEARSAVPTEKPRAFETGVPAGGESVEAVSP